MMEWDDRKGKYVKPFTKKKIELLPYLYLEGYRLYWDLPLPPNIEELNKKYSSDDNTSEEELENITNSYMEEYKKAIDLEIKYEPYYKLEKYLNMVLSVLPYIPLTGIILGVI